MSLIGAPQNPGATPATGGANPQIIDVTIETFERDVLQASMSAPVVVDFWAPWCGPCKTLTPMLEKAVTDAGNGVTLAKIDIDKNQMLASQLRIQSVPTVYAFFQGRPVDGFQGAVPDSEVKAFVDRLTGMAAGGGEALGQPNIDEILAAAEAALGDGRAAEAADAFASVAQAVGPEDETFYVRALAGLAKCHLALHDMAQAQQIFDAIPEDKRDDPALAGVAAALSLAKPGVDGREIARLKAEADASPQDMPARFAYAEGLIGIGDMEAGITALLDLIEADREWNEGAARKKLLTVFDALGPTDKLTVRGRRRLSSILFS